MGLTDQPQEWVTFTDFRWQLHVIGVRSPLFSFVIAWCSLSLPSAVMSLPSAVVSLPSAVVSLPGLTGQSMDPRVKPEDDSRMGLLLIPIFLGLNSVIYGFKFRYLRYHHGV